MSGKAMLGACRVCGSLGVFHLCQTPNEHSKTSPLDHFRCADCGSVFVGNAVDSEELGVAYASLNTKSYFEEVDVESRSKMASAIRALERFLTKDSKIIDVGTGSGLFVEILHNAGYKDVSAHEIEGSDLSRIKGIASRVYQDFDYHTVPSETFDAATLLDVVEHVMDPKSLIRACARMLKPGGMIYFHTPVVTATDRLMHRFQKLPILRKAGTIWQRGRTSIFHLQNYTPKSLRGVLENAGFDDIRIEVKNELSWPVTRYVRLYLLEKQGLPGFLAPLFVPLVYPFLATNAFNANKSIVSARKSTAPARA